NQKTIGINKTWHTIEFSNNNHTRPTHPHGNKHSAVISAGATSQTYPTCSLKSKSGPAGPHTQKRGKPPADMQNTPVKPAT
ncbi:hypothetical protein, partial [Arthrobacter sp. STN4]|uniref:hypothetical protein n=1 Tax=Arthrobacter sp. STN4 TaxID=2923276 RepID=UPI00211A8CA1